MIDYSAIPDQDLYGMCVEGDQGAWQYMYNYILIVCKWRKWNLSDEPEELAQQIALHLIEKAIKKIKEKTKFRNFVTVMTINKIKDSFKSSTFREEPLEKSIKKGNGEEIPVEYIDPRPLHEKVIMDLEIVSIIDAAILKLPESCQKVVREYLKLKMGFYNDYKELSKVLKMHIPTISSKVRRCLNKLMELKEMKELVSIYNGG